MKKNLITIIILYSLLNNSIAQTQNTSINAFVEQELMADEWSGPKTIIHKLIKANRLCDTLSHYATKFRDKSFAIRRLMIIGMQVDCSFKYGLADGYLDDKDPVMVAESIKLANTFSNEKKQGFRKRIQKILSSSNDYLVKKHAKIFLSNFK